MKEIIKKREGNFELLRIISMFMIVTLHLLYNEGVLYSDVMSHSYILGWSIESLFIVAANIYVLISGYFLVKSNFSYAKVFKIWISVIFYSYLISLILYFLKNDFNLVYDIKSLLLVGMPIINGEYWFVTNYMLMFILSPFINKLILNLSKDEYKKMLLTIFIIFICIKSFLPFCAYNFDKTGGYGIIWFIILYLFAGYIRLHYESKINKYFYLLGYILSSALICFIKFFVESKNLSDSYLNYYNGPLYDYNHLLVFISSICLFLFFKEIKIKSEWFNKFICKISKYTFGVYLIHEQYFMRKVLWQNLVHVENFLSSKYLIIYILFSALIVFITCIIIDIIRNFLFKFLCFVKNNIYKKIIG